MTFGITRQNDRLTLTLALSYGGRQEIVAATRFLAWEAKAGRIDPIEIDLAAFSNCLMTSNIPNPDILIRTSGEKRISNFLLCQIADSGAVFMDVLWPDFSEEHLVTAIRMYQDYSPQFSTLANVY